ncbi:uncharacterized protein LOC126978332 [Leptidea sinapis]|uniref:uncharacterized protein LOC126978332 n=1 Tax=Leptidea sinapis TaxID=189913 RepID=UPI0021C33A8C|nr:uncharacterized protein LOC126978332 [Leptidea sinapis]
MFNIESYVTPILLSYVDKYVRDFKPADAQVSLWAGGVTLHNLVLKADVLQQEVSIPFTLVSGRIHELLIQVPWTKIMSEPIVVTINTIECILGLHPPPTADESPPLEAHRSQVVEAPPGYMQALVRRIVSNISIRIHSLIVKYVHDDIVLSLNVKRLSVDSVGADWQPTFADIDQNDPIIRRLIRLDDLTLCLDKSDSDGKIRFYQEPLLYRCQLDLRVLTRLISANKRRARSLTVQLRCSRLAWGVTSEQLLLLLRLLKERPPQDINTPSPMPKQSSSQNSSIHAVSSNSVEPARLETWSEWAWSWMPTWIDRDGFEETSTPAAPIPITFSAFFEHMSLVYKVMEMESSSRKRARGIIELSAADVVIRSSLCVPTLIRVKLGARRIALTSRGRCVCGHSDMNAEEPTVYLSNTGSDEGQWTWNDQDLDENKIELGVVADEQMSEPADSARRGGDELDMFWTSMAPVLYAEYNHDRTPSNALENPYDNPPEDFQYSDWVEDNTVKVIIAPMTFTLSTGLLHRLNAIKKILNEVMPAPTEEDFPVRVLTVEECDALSENLPQRRIFVEVTNVRIRFLPWDHSVNEKPAKPSVLLVVELPKGIINLASPLYPHRVCSAACQMPDDNGPLSQGSRLHVSGTFSSLQAKISAPDEDRHKPFARADLKFVVHSLLHKDYFKRHDNVNLSYSLKINEANICGSSARSQAALQVLVSLFTEQVSQPLWYTTLVDDALHDEESVAVDVTLEYFSVRGYLTKNINTHIMSLHSAKATVLQATSDEQVKQAWLLSGPESPTTTPYLRTAFQWCAAPDENSIDYLGIWIEPSALSIDPLFVTWLAYRPKLKPLSTDLNCQSPCMKMSSSQYLFRRRTTPPSSSGRGSKTGSGAEVHVRTRSVESSSERSERKQSMPAPELQSTPFSGWLNSERLMGLYDRLKRVLITAEIGLTLVYITETSACAVECETIRDAMERHALAAQRVFAISLARWSMHTNSAMTHIWQEIRHDGPTFLTPKKDEPIEESFPWKMRIADLSCYTLEVRAGTERSGRDKYMGALKSQLQASRVPMPRTVLEILATSLTLSIVTKSLQITMPKKPQAKKRDDESKEDDKTKYFTGGFNFKPSSLKEFVRGPLSRKKSPSPEPKVEPAEAQHAQTSRSGPIVSFGVNLHADTPPVIVRLDHDQVHAVAVAIHCFTHLGAILTRTPMQYPKQSCSSIGIAQRALIRSVSEQDEQRSLSEDTSEHRSEQLISIFEAHRAREPIKVKTFFWCQWVISRVSLVVASPCTKLAFDTEDVIASLDLQQHYNQLKIKIACGSVRHYERIHGSDDWKAGVLDGRVLEVGEPTNAMEENNFLAVTVTQAQISNLPESWKEEIDPKLIEQNAKEDSVWEIYATVAPLEAAIQPEVLEQIVSLVRDLSPKSSCPLKYEARRASPWLWPFCYVSAGGLRLLITDNIESNLDDTFIFSVGKVTVNPHPENPICRRTIKSATESTWAALNPGLEGRQYEVLMQNLAVRSTSFKQLTVESEMLRSTSGENPAFKWSQPVISPTITPVLHSVDLSYVLAPALFCSGALVYGPAVEVNLVSDCAIELSLNTLQVALRVIDKINNALQYREGNSMMLVEEAVTCPYSSMFVDQQSLDSSQSDSDAVIVEEILRTSPETKSTVNADSGVDTATSQSTFKLNYPETSAQAKKSVSIALPNYNMKPSEYMEIFVTMGVIKISLYVSDDGSPEVTALRPPAVTQPQNKEADEPAIKVIIDEAKPKKSHGNTSVSSGQSLTETTRHEDMVKQRTHFTSDHPLTRKIEGIIPLINVTLHQPNLYYWRRKIHKNLQVSLFNLWVGFGTSDEACNETLLRTAQGLSDPETDIPPALATLRAEQIPGSYVSGHAARGSIQLDIERPVLLELSTDKLKRIKGVMSLIEKYVPRESKNDVDPSLPASYKLRRCMVRNNIESIIIQTSQMGVRSEEGAGGWERLQAQMACASKPDRLISRVLIEALVITAGPSTDTRHVVLHPICLGGTFEANWESHRRVEILCTHEPRLRIAMDIDRVILDLRPQDLSVVADIRDTLKEIFEPTQVPDNSLDGSLSSDELMAKVAMTFNLSEAFNSKQNIDQNYYKDDLRSGAFKIVSAEQLPMAYQVTIYSDSVSWRYPHPRAITRLIAYPIPGMEKETECVLELYNSMLHRWETHTFFKMPTMEERELKLNTDPSDAAFAFMWRVRICLHSQIKTVPFEFNASMFMPKRDPFVFEMPPQQDYYSKSCPISAEQLSAALRVDSYFAPRSLPRLRVGVRLVNLDINVHNALPKLTSDMSKLEGYYVSRPLCRSHRTLTMRLTDTAVHFIGAAKPKVNYDSKLSCDVIDSATGTMVQFVDEFRIQGALYVSQPSKLRIRIGDVRLATHVPRIYTLRSLADDWKRSYDENINKTKCPEMSNCSVMEKLQGRVSLWIHNESEIALRVGQQGTDEVVPLGPGVSLSYRWRSPTAPKRIRFAKAGPAADWHWSMSIPFKEGKCRVKLENSEKLVQYEGPYLHVRVHHSGPTRNMYLSTGLQLINATRLPLIYKVRSRRSGDIWQTTSSGDLHPETIGMGVLSYPESDSILKVKISSQQESGWSGDIPLRECRKENVPWLVKVPSNGAVPYISVWCRVIRGKNDGRIVAAIWPFYILTSHLPLDVDVQILTDAGISHSGTNEESQPIAILETAPGRGTSTHLIAAGTTSARHTLTFRYCNIECPVTREAVPLHYSVTEKSVFEKSPALASVDELLDIVTKWFTRSAREAKPTWPYSIVTNHWTGTWQPALLQPRCDVNVSYNAVRAGGGCSLELQLCPAVLFANASPIAITLRSYDAAPLCKLEPGVAMCPPSVILKKPFFMSVEMGRETFVSGQLEVCEHVGRYDTGTRGRVTLDRACAAAIHCNQKVALLTLYYEIKENINVLGVTSTYVLINRLNTDILVSAIAVPTEMDSNTVLRPKMYKCVRPVSSEGESNAGVPLCRFWVVGRWRGGHAEELRTFLCLSLAAGTCPAHTPVPVRLGQPPLRKPIALRNEYNVSVPVVVCQQIHEDRCIITIAEDPCPQYVIHNRTGKSLTVAEPTDLIIQELSTRGNIQAVEECEGALWRCVVAEGTLTHYTSPSHCGRFPPTCDVPRTLPLLTVSTVREEIPPEWCQPIVVTDGEQLLQMSGGMTIKVRVRTHPHSTLIEFLDIDQNDISASDIRRRLLGPLPSDTVLLDDDNSEEVLQMGPIQKLRYPSGNESSDSVDESEVEDTILLTFRKRSSDENKEKENERHDFTPRGMVIMRGTVEVLRDSSLANVSAAVHHDIAASLEEAESLKPGDAKPSQSSMDLQGANYADLSEQHAWMENDRIACVIDSITVSVANSWDVRPILGLHLRRVAVRADLRNHARKTRVILTAGDVQVDNPQYEDGQYDFAVVACARADIEEEQWPPLWNIADDAFQPREDLARLMVKTCCDRWTVANNTFSELTEVEAKIGPLALYVEDAYVTAIVELVRLAMPPTRTDAEAVTEAETIYLQKPLRLRRLYLHPLDLTLTLHTAVRMYIALDQSPLRLSAFQLQDMMTTTGRLTHALTVHYLSAAILGAGWVVGGLELLGAPGALAARVGGASGGVRGIASTAAAALLRSLCSCAGSLARNLDLLAGDEEHASRAAAARRRPPPSFMAGLVAGVSNFAINILGAVGGLAHHPLVGVAVGESESSTTALRRGLLGAITKPLSATADLVAYAGHGLLTQTGWEPVLKPRLLPDSVTAMAVVGGGAPGWRRDCVRWTFRLAELMTLAGFEVLLDDVQLHLLLTNKFLVIAEPESERIVEMIDFKTCSITPYNGHVIQLQVAQRKPSRLSEIAVDEDNEYQISAAAMARVARFTGAGVGAEGEVRVLTLQTALGLSHALHAALTSAIHHNNAAHFALL